MYRRKPKGWIKHLDFIILDLISLNIAYIVAYMLRHGLKSPYVTEMYAMVALIFTAADFFVILFNNTMKNVLRRGLYQEFAITFKHVITVDALVIVILFATQFRADYSRIVIYLTGALYFIPSFLLRILYKKILQNVLKHTGITSLVIFTEKDKLGELPKVIYNLTISGYRITGICVMDGDYKGQNIAGVEVVENADGIIEYLCREWVDEVFFFENHHELHKILIDKLVEMGIVIHLDLTDLFELSTQKQTVDKMAGHRVLTLSMNNATIRQLVLKRVMDIAAGLVGCLITLVLIVILGPLIFISSPGPIFFAQTRIGRNGKKFKMYKFRSMYLDAEERKKELMAENRVADGMMFKLDYDPRIIGCKKRPDGTIKKGIGNFIREYSLDEFPQFFNVLIGQMSLCGTRPPTEDEWNKYELHHRARLAIKPGITGLWQVSGRSNIIDFEEVVELDKQYIRDWSMALDMKILFKTLMVVFKKEGSM
ncbi:MAG: sugar transferase [Lachnospiraceae bacterium]